MNAKQLRVVNRVIKTMGGIVETGRKLGITTGAVQHWRTRGIPQAKVKRIELATGIPRALLRPDIYE